METPQSLSNHIDTTTSNSDKVDFLSVLKAGLIALFAVIFLWGFWSKGITALGLNFTLFSLMSATWLIFQAHNKDKITKNWFWIIPISFMIFSFAFYENPFVKLINILVLPLSFAIFFNFSVLKDNQHKIWNFHFMASLLKRLGRFISMIKPARLAFFSVLFPKHKKASLIIKKSLLGIVIFLLLASILIVPLLSSADPLFAERINFIMAWLQTVFSMSFVAKLIFFGLISIGLLSLKFGWASSFDIDSKKTDFKIDSLIAGIVMGGVLLLYILFLWIQLERLWVDTLPMEFKATESLVKTGFWELFWLSVINVIFFFLYYRATNQAVQRLLIGFTLASLLMLLSAGQKMYLYVTLYGFSYEKFYASYTVLYSIILFCWLIYCLFHHEKKDIFKFLLISFVWMYSISTILPVEKFVFQANVALQKSPTSRIKLYELKMLSNDVLSDVKDYVAQNPTEAKTWDQWILKQEERTKSKAWYEMNLGNWRE